MLFQVYVFQILESSRSLNATPTDCDTVADDDVEHGCPHTATDAHNLITGSNSDAPSKCFPTPDLVDHVIVGAEPDVVGGFYADAAEAAAELFAYEGRAQARGVGPSEWHEVNQRPLSDVRAYIEALEMPRSCGAASSSC